MPPSHAASAKAAQTSSVYEPDSGHDDQAGAAKSPSAGEHVSDQAGAAKSPSANDDINDDQSDTSSLSDDGVESKPRSTEEVQKDGRKSASGDKDTAPSQDQMVVKKSEQGRVILQPKLFPKCVGGFTFDDAKKSIPLGKELNKLEIAKMSNADDLTDHCMDLFCRMQHDMKRFVCDSMIKESYVIVGSDSRLNRVPKNLKCVGEVMKSVIQTFSRLSGGKLMEDDLAIIVKLQFQMYEPNQSWIRECTEQLEGVWGVEIESDRGKNFVNDCMKNVRDGFSNKVRGCMAKCYGVVIYQRLKSNPGSHYFKNNGSVVIERKEVQLMVENKLTKIWLVGPAGQLDLKSKNDQMLQKVRLIVQTGASAGTMLEAIKETLDPFKEVRRKAICTCISFVYVQTLSLLYLPELEVKGV